jgi:hypothetical protein
LTPKPNPAAPPRLFKMKEILLKNNASKNKAIALFDTHPPSCDEPWIGSRFAKI